MLEKIAAGGLTGFGYLVADPADRLLRRNHAPFNTPVLDLRRYVDRILVALAVSAGVSQGLAKASRLQPAFGE